LWEPIPYKPGGFPWAFSPLAFNIILDDISFFVEIYAKQ